MTGLSGAQARIATTALRLFAERGSSSLTVSELAAAAGVARGTIYNNFSAPDALFEEIAARLADVAHHQIAHISRAVTDPAERVSIGIRFFVRQAQEQPDWGRFVLQFAMSNAVLQGVWAGQPAVDLKEGMTSGRFTFAAQQELTFPTMMAGVVLAAILLVVDGHKAWREAGADAAEFVLRALGLEAEEARRIARLDLPVLSV
jgi:AcrR family transcriptional regulator